MPKIEAIASAMPGCDGAWTVAVFKGEDVPVGTKVIPVMESSAAPIIPKPVVSKSDVVSESDMDTPVYSTAEMGHYGDDRYQQGQVAGMKAIHAIDFRHVVGLSGDQAFQIRQVIEEKLKEISNA